MIVIVAVIGLILGLVVMGQRRAKFLEIASSYADREKSSLAIKEMYESFVKVNRGEADFERKFRSRKPDSEAKAQLADEEATINEKHLETAMNNTKYYAQMRGKYEKAARYPWLHIDPDPPRPPAVD